MTKRQERQYEDTEILRQILLKTLMGRKFRLDCGIMQRVLLCGVRNPQTPQYVILVSFYSA